MTVDTPSMSGKVLDGSAVLALTSGNLGALSWLSVATTMPLTLVVPAAARDEALLARPDQRELLRRLLEVPVVVGHDAPADADRRVISEGHVANGVFDPLASWVVGICRERGWSALTTDPARLRRIDPDVDCDVV